MKRIWLLLGLIFLISCQGQTAVSEPTAQTVEQPAVEEVAAEPTTEPVEPEQPTAVPTTAPVVEEGQPEEATLPPPTVPVEPTPEPVAEEVNFMQTGRTPLGAYYLGSPEAPIRLIDYSDFL